jgi:phosphate transport system substrate-binding protein
MIWKLLNWRSICARVITLTLLFGFCYVAPVIAEEFVIGGSGAAIGTMEQLAQEFHAKNPDIRVRIVPSLGSSGGIRAVLDGVIGLAVTSRALTASERKLGAVEIEFARTPFVFAVSKRSPVSMITTRELADIYSGKLTVWPDGSLIRIVLRPASDIDTDMVKNISAEIRRGVLATEARPGVRFSVNDQDAASDLEKIPGAIGPTTLALITSESRALRALKLDGQEPSPANAATGAYPYFKSLFLVTGAKRTAAVELFIAFMKLPAAEKIILGNGQWIPRGRR